MPDNAAGTSVLVRPLLVEFLEALPNLSSTWSRRAICHGEDPDIFFPAYGDPGIRAKRVCTRCPVRIDCLEHAIAKDEWGIWGGLDREQRRALRNCDGEQDSPANVTVRSDEGETVHD